MKYVYECKGKIKELKDDQETIVEHKHYFCVVCTECSNVPVLHSLERTDSSVYIIEKSKDGKCHLWRAGFLKKEKRA
jgi:hypothetical protein